MFFILSKIAYFFIAPFTWLLVSLGLFIFSRGEKVRKWSKIAVISIALFFSNSFIFKEFVRTWEVHSIPQDEISNHDVAIVLGGMFEYDNDANRLTVRRGADRIWQALNLYHAGKVKKILISGDHGYVTDRGLHESEQLANNLIEWGIPKEDLIIEIKSKNTYENAKESVAILKEKYPDLKTAVLVTSATHMKRALACFKKQKLSVTPYSTDQFTGNKRHYHWDEFLIPNASNFNNWFTLIKEWVGFVSYKIVGYI